MRWRWFASSIVGAFLLATAQAKAQGSCSVPHGSPAAPTNSFVLVEPPGSGWLQVTIYHLDTRSRFGPDARNEPFFADGRLNTQSLFVTGAVGVVRGVDVWAQLPVHRLVFREVSGDRRATGIGDPRFYLRIGPNLFGLRPTALPLGVALRGGVKFPGRDFPVDAQVIPLTEGQRDWEALVELGRLLDPVPVYVMGWFGYRWREANAKASLDPGNERFGFLAVGSTKGPLTLRLGVQGLWGDPPVIGRFEVPTARRRMLELLPTLARALGPGELQIGARFPVSGRNLPGGTALNAGYFLRWGKRDAQLEDEVDLKKLLPKR